MAPAGGLRRFVRGRTEPEAPEPEPETKIVRQQPVRQSRSRRSVSDKAKTSHDSAVSAGT